MVGHKNFNLRSFQSDQNYVVMMGEYLSLFIQILAKNVWTLAHSAMWPLLLMHLCMYIVPCKIGLVESFPKQKFENFHTEITAFEFHFFPFINHRLKPQ